MAHERRAGRRVAPGGDVDRRGGRESELDRLCRPGGAGAEELDRSQAGRAAGGGDRAAAGDLVVAGSAAAKRPRAERQEYQAEGRGEDAAQTYSEDGMMLPQVMPMLAVAAEPFDSPEYSFEIKWDGVRALAAVEETGWRLWGRERADYTARYPELEVLRRLPAGTLVDGEVVAFDADGRPDLRRLLRRHGLTDPWRIRQARQWCPVRYVLFDLLYHAGRCLMHEPLVLRRELLAEVCEKLDATEVEFSPAVIGAGTMLYQTVLTAGHEGVMAKQIRSEYRPGKRSNTWKKIKPPTARRRSQRDIFSH